VPPSFSFSFYTCLRWSFFGRWRRVLSNAPQSVRKARYRKPEASGSAVQGKSCARTNESAGGKLAGRKFLSEAGAAARRKCWEGTPGGRERGTFRPRKQELGGREKAAPPRMWSCAAYSEQASVVLGAGEEIAEKSSSPEEPSGRAARGARGGSMESPGGARCRSLRGGLLMFFLTAFPRGLVPKGGGEDQGASTGAD